MRNVDRNLCLLVEDQATTRRWLAQAIVEAVGTECIVEQTNLKAAQQWLASLGGDDAYPWLAVIDIGLPDGCGIEIVRTLAAASPRTLAVVATIYGDDAHLMEAIAAGAQGYILKEEDRERIVVTLRRIESDEPPLSPSIARRMLDHFRDQPVATPTHSDLTARETETLALIARGLTVSEAAGQLGLTANTVAGYVKVIYQKLGITTRAEAACEAMRRGLA